MSVQPKFKKGQEVRVLSVEEGYYEYDSFTERMVKMIGNVFTIVDVSQYDDYSLYYLVDNDGNEWVFQEDWLESV